MHVGVGCGERICVDGCWRETCGAIGRRVVGSGGLRTVECGGEGFVWRFVWRWNTNVELSVMEVEVGVVFDVVG